MEELEGRPIPAGTYEGGNNTRTFAILEKAGLGPASKAEPGADQDELFSKAVGDEQAVTDLSAPPTGNTNPRKSTQTVVVFERDREVVAAVLAQANGYCELCGLEAPFTRAATGTPYLEVHHVMPLSKDGDDTVQNSVALCPNCHRRCHYSTDSESTTEILYQRVSRLERQVATDVNL
jgi:5-methylcytosine-specific restriction protein A